uniref:Sialic acid binding Ig like lectin 1 n=1 Tax=Amazona collaria TaxID=241587 RepID=A0A8B9G884_9PSIT
MDHAAQPCIPLPLSHTALGSWGVTYPRSLRGINGSCVVIPCSLSFPEEVAADDGLVAIWYKDYNNQKTLVFHSADQEVDVHFRGRAQLLGDPSARNCTLQLQRVAVGDSGPYRFRFEIVNGDRWSAAQDVVLKDLEKPSIAPSEEQTEGQTSTFECSTPYVCPLGDVALRWEGHDPQVSVVSGRVQMDTSGVGHYLTLTTSFSWRDHSKKLLCEVSYGSRKATREVHLGMLRLAEMLLIDSSSSFLPADPPRNLHLKAFVESNEGTAVILLCTVDSNPLSEITLLKEGVVVASSPAMGRDHRVSPSPNTLRLELREASEEDEGEYECRARSPLGSTHESLPLRVPPEPHLSFGEGGNTVLVIVDAPQAPSFISLVDPRGGQHIVLLCTVDSVPPSDIALHHGDGQAPLASTWGPSDPRVTVEATPNSLRVGMGLLEPGDAGVYVCSANNSIGTASSSLRLDAGGEGGPEPQTGAPRGYPTGGSGEPLGRCCPQGLGTVPALPQGSRSLLSPLQRCPRAPPPP